MEGGSAWPSTGITARSKMRSGSAEKVIEFVVGSNPGPDDLVTRSFPDRTMLLSDSDRPGVGQSFQLLKRLLQYPVMPRCSRFLVSPRREERADPRRSVIDEQRRRSEKGAQPGGRERVGPSGSVAHSSQVAADMHFVRASPSGPTRSRAAWLVIPTVSLSAKTDEMGYRQRGDTLCALHREFPGPAWSKRARNSAASLRSQALQIEWPFALSGGFAQEYLQLRARLRVCEDPLPGRVAVLRVASSSPLLYEQDGKSRIAVCFSGESEAASSAIRVAISDGGMRAPYRTLRNLSKQFVGKGMALQNAKDERRHGFLIRVWSLESRRARAERT